MTYSPLVIFSEKDFTRFYEKFSASLGYRPHVKSIGGLTPVEWEEVRPVMEREDYTALTQMADARDPDPNKTSLGLEVPEYGVLWFGKILVDGKPQGIALNSTGKLGTADYPIPESIVKGSIVYTSRFEPVQWKSLDDVATEYRLGSNVVDEADLAFLSIIDGVFRQLQTHHPNQYAQLFGKDSLVIGDIGCGPMSYGVSLAHYFTHSGKKVVIVGIDPETKENRYLFEHYKDCVTELNPGAGVNFIPIPHLLEESVPQLEQAGIKSFDLVTMFNPRDVIDIGDLPVSFRESALFLGALDDNHGYPFLRDQTRGASRDEVKRNLADNDYMVLSENTNPYINANHGTVHKYNPIITAKRIPELV